MPVVAKLKYLRIAPRKVRLVADLIRGKSVKEAQTLLQFTVKKANEPVLKLLKSAIASARNNFQLQESNLYICKISVDEGPKYKRHMPRARGQAYEIQKKTSHITILLDEIIKKPKEIKKIKKSEEIEKTEEKVEEKPEEKIPKKEKPELKPEIRTQRPKIERGIRRVFRRKAF